MDLETWIVITTCNGNDLEWMNGLDRNYNVQWKL